MPDIKVYLRAEDIDKWNAIEKKAEWLHIALAAFDVHPEGHSRPSLKTTSLEKSLAQRGVDTSIVGTLPISTPRFDKGACKVHGLPLDDRGRCLQKGCKYS